MSSMHATNKPSPGANLGQDGDRAKSHIQELKKDAAAVRDDLAQLKDDAVRAAGHVTESASGMIREHTGSASDLFRQANSTCKKYHGAMRDTVETHPTASVLVALGAGVMIGRMLGGR